MSAAIGSASAFASQNQTSQVGNGFGNLSSNEFLQIILSELSNQDPLAPNDTTALLEQLSSLRSIESQVSLESELKTLVTQNAISSSAGMIGKFVEGLDDTNQLLGGIVDSLSIENGKPILKLSDGTSLPAERVTQVREVDAAIDNTRLLGGIDPNALLGTLVAGLSSQGESLTGIVTGIRIEGGEGFLELDNGIAMPFENLQRISPSSFTR